MIASLSERDTAATGWLVAIHSASCGYRLLRCESGGAGLRYDFRRRKIRLRLKLILFGRSRLTFSIVPASAYATHFGARSHRSPRGTALWREVGRTTRLQPSRDVPIAGRNDSSGSH